MRGGENGQIWVLRNTGMAPLYICVYRDVGAKIKVGEGATKLPIRMKKRGQAIWTMLIVP